MKPYPVIAGEVWRELTLTGRARFRRDKQKTYVECVCSCGKRGWHVFTSVRSGKITSCGHARRDRWLKLVSRNGAAHRLWKGHGEISWHAWCCIVRNADTRGIAFDLTIEEAWQLFLKQDRRCALTGVPLVFAASRSQFTDKTASLDRIDSNGTYVLSNVHWVHKVVNFMKHELSTAELVKWCRLVAAHAEIAT